MDAPVFLARGLEEANAIIFAGGTHRDAVKMSGEDFLKLVRPVVVDLVREGEMQRL